MLIIPEFGMRERRERAEDGSCYKLRVRKKTAQIGTNYSRNPAHALHCRHKQSVPQQVKPREQLRTHSHARFSRRVPAQQQPFSRKFKQVTRSRSASAAKTISTASAMATEERNII